MSRTASSPCTPAVPATTTGGCWSTEWDTVYTAGPTVRPRCVPTGPDMIIAHDLGTSGNKASLHEDDGRLLDSVTVSYPTDYRHGGIAEQDPRDWERAVIDATRRLVRQAGVQASRVSGLVVSGQMMGAVLLDHRYEPVRPAIIWADTRAHAPADRLS